MIKYRDLDLNNFKMVSKTTFNAGSKIMSLCYSPDGKLLASGDYATNDAIIKLWNA